MVYSIALSQGFNQLDSDSLQLIIAQADQLYADRQNIASVSESVALLTQAQADCFAVAWRLSRAHFFLGQESQFPKAVKRLHATGVEAGRMAEKLRKDRVEGHFWLGVNLALAARLVSPRKTVGHILEGKAALRRAIEIDASYHAAGPLRVLARLQHQLPRLLGGSVSEARANFERAIKIAPQNTVTRIYFAQMLLALREKTSARFELEHVLSTPHDPAWAFEIDRDQRLAKKMLAAC